jgi:hypothetical protein
VIEDARNGGFPLTAACPYVPCESSDAVATATAHKIKRPLSVMITNADPAVLWVDRSMPDIDKASAALKRIASNGRRAGAVIGKHSNDVQEGRACSLRLITVTFPGLVVR